MTRRIARRSQQIHLAIIVMEYVISEMLFRFRNYYQNKITIRNEILIFQKFLSEITLEMRIRSLRELARVRVAGEMAVVVAMVTIIAIADVKSQSKC